MAKSYKTTEEDFELFKSECQKWIDFFGLKSWEVFHSHQNLNDNAAWCLFNDLKERLVRIGLAVNWDDTEPTKHAVRLAAFHEVCEVLIFRLFDLAISRYSTEDQLLEARHELIRTLENCVFK